MPALKQFTADITPDNIIHSGKEAQAQDFGGSIGAATQGLGNSIQSGAGTVLQTFEREDAMKASMDMAQLRKNAMEKLDQLRQTGQPVADKFNEYFDEQVQGVRENRTTQHGLATTNAFATNLASEMGHQARMADVELAGQQARNQMHDTIAANGTALQKDPSLLDKIIGEQNFTVDQIEGVAPEQRAAIKRELTQEAAKNAVRGWTSLDPQSALDKLNNGDWDKYLNADAKAALIGHAKQEIRSQEAQDRIAQAEAERQKRDEQNQLMNNSLADWSQGKLSAGQVASMARDQNLSPEQTSHLFTLLDKQARDGETKKSDPLVLVDVVNGLHEGSLDQETLNNYVLHGGLSESDYQRYSQAVNEGDTALRHVRAQTSRDVGQAFFGVFPGFPKTSEQVNAQVKFDALVRDREKEYRDDGKNPVDYYTSGQFEQDARALAPKRGALGGADDFRQSVQAATAEGKPVAFPDGRTYKYTGQGPKTDMANWKEVTKPNVNTDMPNYYQFVKDTGGRIPPGGTVKQAYADWAKSKGIE